MESQKSQRRVIQMHPAAVTGTLNPSLQDRLKNMNHKDMQKASLLKGMRRRDVIKADFWRLLSFLEKNWYKEDEPSLLLKFDQWLDRQLEKKGLPPVDPVLRMSYVREEDISEEAMEKKAEKKAKVVKEKSEPREKTDYGIVIGTQKHFVYELVKKGKSTERIIERTQSKYPDAKANSIKIWISKAKKCFKEVG